MSGKAINEAIPYDLSYNTFDLATGIGALWNVGINGEGYLLSTLEDEAPFEYRAYTVSAIPVQKQRLDTSEEPGEQTLEQWWMRAQHDWSMGAGQDVFDAPGSDRSAFQSSRGIDIWTQGKIKLLKDTATKANHNADDLSWLVAGGYIFYSLNGQIYRGTTLDGTFTASNVNGPGAGGTVKSITSDGANIYVCFAGSNNIQKADIDSGSWSSEGSLANNLDPEIISFVKGRLMAGKDNKLFEVDLTTTDEPDPLFTHRTTDWTWSAITEAGPAIFASGFAGETSEIYATRLTTQDLAYANTSTLGAPISVYKAPEGEVIHTVKGYLGKALVIGTSKGVRIAVITDDTGSLEVSSLIVGSEEGVINPVKSIELQGDYAYFGWTKFDGTYSGLGRIDLGDTTFASDLMYGIQGDVTSIAEFGGRLMFAVNNVSGAASHLVIEHATQYCSDGFLDTGEIRYGTFEAKTLRFFDALLKGTGQMDVLIKKDGESSYSEFILDWVANSALIANKNAGIVETALDEEVSRFELRLELKRSSANATPELLEWRVRAEPKVSGRFRYFVPIMLYDTMVALNGQSLGYPSYSQERLNDLMTLYRDGTLIKFQDPGSHLTNGNSPATVKIEDLQFKSWAPPSGFSGPGGIALLVMREQT